MNYVFAIFMVIAAMIGGWWMFKLSNENYDLASGTYACVGVLWGAACLGMALRVI